MPHLKVIRASAGSGKTYTLANEYLRLLFADTENFRHILAVTFTNKATNEMKSRIVRELHTLSSGQPASMLADLMEHTEFTEKQIRNKAAIILKKILHQYSGFSVSTIDSFFQQIIRAFTRELGLQGTYSIELDTETLLTTVIDKLLVRAETDKSLLNWLGNYAESLIEKGESWNFRKSIRTLGKEIFREEFKSLPDNVLKRFNHRDSLRQYQQDLFSRLRTIESDYRNFGKRTAAILQRSGLSTDDFSMKQSGPAGFLMKLATGEFRKPTPTAILAAGNVEKWYTRNSSKTREIALLAGKELMPLMQRTVEYYDAYHLEYYTLEVILKNIYTLGILSDLSQLAYQWCSENNAFLLPEAPQFLQKIIDGNDTPFIYEKAGYWFNHFMIDEFQDTSIMQWLNFRPLISNSLSQGFDNLVVGDVKQSIYRWRNSTWTILAGELEKEFQSGIIRSRSLDRNWRSGMNIIKFNNNFFQEAAGIMDQEFRLALESGEYSGVQFADAPVSRIYSDTRQEPGDHKRPDGLVRISFLQEEDDHDFYDLVNRDLVQLLGELLDKGYSPSDIALITRKNKEAKLLADFLLSYNNENPDFRHKLDVISDEALRLGSSPVVIFLTSLLQYLVDPGDPICSYYILVFFKNHLSGQNNTDRRILPDHDANARQKELSTLLPASFFDLTASTMALSLSELTERLISIFGLSRFTGELVYLDAFRDLIQEYGQKQVADPVKFIEYWHETGKEKSVSAPAGQEAVRILTIHKSKGLEFNIVIIPYCTWELTSMHNTILWCKPDNSFISGSGAMPVNYSSKLKKTYFAGQYYEELLNQYIDNLNLLYVAFTRPCDALYIYCKQEKEDTLKNVGGLAQKILNEHLSVFDGNFDERGNYFTSGYLADKDKNRREKPGEIFEPEGIPVENVSGRIHIAYAGKIYMDPTVHQPKRPINEGKILHEIFTSIRTQDDIIRSVTGMFLHGKINQAEKDRYINLIAHLMNDIQVLSWFTGDWKVLTEAEIILPDSMSKRPDRVMMREELALIIDYKFGERMDHAHHRQVGEYIGLLRQMGYPKVEGYLWYVMLDKVVRIDDPGLDQS